MYSEVLPVEMRQVLPKSGESGANDSNYGQIKMTIIPRVLGIGIAVTCLFSYAMSQHLKQEPPFPHCTITMTAGHFPQSVVFRLNMLFFSAITTLLWYVIYSWLGFISRRFELKNVSSNVYYASSFGSLLFALAVATIDTGYMNDNLHALFAIGFFLTWVVCINIFTWKIVEFQFKVKNIISTTSLILKVVSAIAMVLTLIVNIVEALKPDMLGVSQYLAIIEWLITLEMSIWIYSFVSDWEVYYLNLDGEKIALVDYRVLHNKYLEYAQYYSKHSTVSSAQQQYIQ